MTGTTRSRARRALAVAAVLALGLLPACSGSEEPRPRVEPDVVREWVELTLGLAQTEGLSPPAAARLLAYATLALHEASLTQESLSASMASAIPYLGALPRPPARVSPAVAQVAAGAAVLRAMVPTTDAAGEVAHLRDGHLRSLPEQQEASVARGEAVARRVVERAAADGYETVVKMPYRITTAPGRWRPTPPGFGEPLEPHWGRLQPLLSPAVCPVDPPPPFDTTPGSEFRAQLDAVVETSRSLGDSARLTAQYWDDQPVFTATPPGHWMYIALAELQRASLDRPTAAGVVARVAMAMHDAMVSAWHWKFHYDVVRPVTVMRDGGDAVWTPYLNSPPFPEYPSGHSSVSMAAATVLTAFVDIDEFTDTANQEALGTTRQYPSFEAAAQEAGWSRVLGGIHYPSGNVGGQQVGRCAAARALSIGGSRR